MKLLFIENWIGDETLRTIGWTLFHSLWIGLLAAVASGIIIISTRRSTARLRYNLLISIMFLFLLSCGFVFFTQIESSKIAGVELQESTINSAVSDLSSNEQVILIQEGLINEFTQFFNSNAHIVVFIWLIFFVTHCVKLLTGLGGIQRLKNHRTSLPPGEWIIKLNELSKKLGIHQSVTLLQSELIKVPIAIGFFKPVILVPLSLLSNLRPEQVETILLHELAHIRRRDFLMNLLQRFAEAMFFFNPCFIWLCSLIRQEREACCDDIVVATTGQKRNYLEALVSFQELSVTSPDYAMAIKSKQHYLLNRVKRLLTRENKKLNAMEKILLLFGLIVFTAFTIIPQKEER
jgi:beta-lactamase regulating signal transducer with metallopeptidase domain